MCARISVDIESMSKETHRSMQILGASINQNPDAKKKRGDQGEKRGATGLTRFRESRKWNDMISRRFLRGRRRRHCSNRSTWYPFEWCTSGACRFSPLASLYLVLLTSSLHLKSNFYLLHSLHYRPCYVVLGRTTRQQSRSIIIAGCCIGRCPS